MDVFDREVVGHFHSPCSSKFCPDKQMKMPCTCHEVEEGEALKVLGFLVAELHNLVVALPQSLYSQSVPGVLLVDLLQARQSQAKNVHAVDKTGRERYISLV